MFVLLWHTKYKIGGSAGNAGVSDEKKNNNNTEC